LPGDTGDAGPGARDGGLELAVECLTEETLRSAAGLHLEVFRDGISPLLTAPSARAYVGWFVRDASAIALGLRVEGALRGYALGAFLDRLPRLERRVLGLALGGLLTRPWRLLSGPAWASAPRRIRVLFGAAPLPHLPVCPPTMCLNALGVIPACRGQGLGGRLLDAFEAESRVRGARSAVLTVLAGNVRAQSLYRARGWKACGVVDRGGRLVFARDLGAGGAG
jgi:GNAT superfamily N-acetyltransferase